MKPDRINGEVTTKKAGGKQKGGTDRVETKIRVKRHAVRQLPADSKRGRESLSRSHFVRLGHQPKRKATRPSCQESPPETSRPQPPFPGKGTLQ